MNRTLWGPFERKHLADLTDEQIDHFWLTSRHETISENLAYIHAAAPEELVTLFVCLDDPRVEAHDAAWITDLGCVPRENRAAVAQTLGLGNIDAVFRDRAPNERVILFLVWRVGERSRTVVWAALSRTEIAIDGLNAKGGSA